MCKYFVNTENMPAFLVPTNKCRKREKQQVIRGQGSHGLASGAMQAYREINFCCL